MEGEERDSVTNIGSESCSKANVNCVLNSKERRSSASDAKLRKMLGNDAGFNLNTRHVIARRRSSSILDKNKSDAKLRDLLGDDFVDSSVDDNDK